MLKRFLSYYKPHRLLFSMDMLASLLVSLIGVVYPMVTREMLNNLIPNRQVRAIVVAAAVLLGLYVVQMLLEFFIQFFGHMMGVRMQAQMRSDMFRHLETLPYRFFDDHETGKIMSRLTNDLMDISELAHHGPENVIISSLSIIVSFLYLSGIHLTLTLIIFSCAPLLFVVAFLLRGRMDRAFTESRRSIAEINASVESSISGIRVTKAFGNAEKEQEKFERGNNRFKEARKKAYFAMGLFHSSTTFITNVFNVVVLIAGGIFLYRGEINFGDYSAFVVSVNIFVSPVMTLIRFTEQFEDGAAGFRRFVEIMDEPPEKDAPDAAVLQHVRGDICLADVSYTYDGAREVLRGVNLNIHAGDTFALVGPSGGGKTTICHLIPRFYTVTNGAITVDGQNVNEVTMQSLRRNIGIVQQDVYLFNASIRENILYGRPDAGEEEVIAAAKRANIHDYVMSLPNGYDTEIGERGVRLSGGQKQRLSIARVFLKNPPILILDEATSALDNATEILIQAALDELCRGRTTIVVAHRLSTVKNASRIAVVDGGRVVEEGTHDELLAAGGMYADLYQSQFKRLA